MFGKSQDLDRRVRKNLEEDPRTADYVIEVINTSGLITLEGVVPSREVKDVAHDIAKNTDGVVSVTNALVVNPDIGKGGRDDRDRLFPPATPASQ
jgi:osmotically-inducible protein OsmY